MFLLFAAPTHSQSPLANGKVCAPSTGNSESYPVSSLRPALIGRLALGREDSS